MISAVVDRLIAGGADVIKTAIEQHLLATRAARFLRPARSIEPHVHALHQVAGDVDVIVLDEDDARAQLGRMLAWTTVSSTSCPGRSAGCALPANTICTGRVSLHTMRLRRSMSVKSRLARL